MRALDPKTPEFILKLKGWQAGDNALEAAFLDGRITTSTSGGATSYPAHYADMWDAANAGTP
jgi:hypothetical protein